MGTLLEERALREVVERIVTAAGVRRAPGASADVEITRRVGDDRVYTFIVKHGDSPVEIVAHGVDLVTREVVDGRATVPAGAVRVIREEGAE